ncbi:MAG: GNAT family N-acetyltransferase [Chthoniobacterales bacterium]|nr:GNAT family N-acetyltransferase [Chthoniobacterales bacterium]MDQ3118607.1 GNAT family N-acetyltransferase [Verrucomicrobiota bacterium]
MDAAAIQLCDADSAAAAVALLRAQLEEHDIETSLEDLREVTRTVLADGRFGFILLAAVNGEAVGLAYAAAHLSAEHGGTIGWLEELYVRPAWRGRGVGGRLVCDVITRAQELGWRGVELEIVAGHERAISLYLRNSFQPLARARFSRIFDR